MALREPLEDAVLPSAGAPVNRVSHRRIGWIVGVARQALADEVAYILRKAGRLHVPLIRKDESLDSHLVLGNGARLVRHDRCDLSKSFRAAETLDHDVLPGQLEGCQRERQGDDHRRLPRDHEERQREPRQHHFL